MSPARCRFASGAVVSLAMSFDVPKHRHVPIEIYGTEASLIVPDPNYFGGRIEIAPTGGEWSEVETRHPFADDNYRSIGVADMAQAIRSGQPHRASGDLAFHVLEVMEAFGRSSDEGRTIAIASRPERPAPAAAGPPRLTDNDTGTQHKGESDARSTDRLGRLERARARAMRRRHLGVCWSKKASRPTSRTRRKPSPTPASPR